MIVNAPSLQQTKPLDVDQSRNECEGQEVENVAGIITNIINDIIDQCQDDVQCGVCGKVFGTETESQQHVDQCVENNRNKDANEAEVEVYQCGECGKCFTKQNDSEIHIEKEYTDRVANFALWFLKQHF